MAEITVEPLSRRRYPGSLAVFRDGGYLGTVAPEHNREGWCVWSQWHRRWTDRHLPTRDEAITRLLALMPGEEQHL